MRGILTLAVAFAAFAALFPTASAVCDPTTTVCVQQSGMGGGDPFCNDPNSAGYRYMSTQVSANGESVSYHDDSGCSRYQGGSYYSESRFHANHVWYSGSLGYGFAGIGGSEYEDTYTQGTFCYAFLFFSSPDTSVSATRTLDRTVCDATALVPS